MGLTIIFSTYSMAEKFYVGVGSGWNTYRNGTYKNGISFILNGGIRVDEVLPNLVAEGEVSYTLLPLEEIFNERAINEYGVDVDILNIGVFIGYIIKLKHSDFKIRPRIGINYAHVYRNDKDNEGKLAIAFGLGASYPITDYIKIYTDITDKGDNNNYTGGLKFSF